MESKNYIIKSNSFAHLFELNSNKSNEPYSLVKSQRNIKLKNKKKLFKPKIINIVSKYPINNEYKKLFSNNKLKVAFNHDVIKQANLKKIKNKNIRRTIYKENLINSLSYNKFDSKNTFYNTNKRNNILPNIFKNENEAKHSDINMAKNNDNALKLNFDNKEDEKSFRITSGILNSKEVYIQRFNKLKINSLLINSFKNKVHIDNEEYTNPWSNLNKEFISRNTLNNERKDSTISLNKKTKSEILNYLYEKYSSLNLSNTNSMNKTNYNDFSKIDKNQKDEDSSNIFKRYNKLLMNLKEINNKIDDNNKININVLFSKAGKKLEKDNIIYDIKKTSIFKG